MSHSLVRIWIHTVLGTKDRQPIILDNFEPALYQHIKDHLENDFACPVRAINGVSNHVHVLFLLSPNYAVKDLLQNIKGESSHWVNEQDFHEIEIRVANRVFSVLRERIQRPRGSAIHRESEATPPNEDICGRMRRIGSRARTADP